MQKPVRYRKILHLDLDAFFCSVEELLDPNLKGKAFAVGGAANSRGVVSSCSYAARHKGVRSAMPTSRALRQCPGLILVGHGHRLYSQYSDRVMEVIGRFTAMIEQISIDEAFIDLTDLPQSCRELAESIQKAVMDEVNLPLSVGCASNKLVAKIATDFGKSGYQGLETPRAIMVVPPGEEAAFLAPLPVQAMWGVGPKSAERMRSLGISTLGELAAMSDARLVQLFGRFGVELGQRARGKDDRPVAQDYGVKSISQETTFAKDVADITALSQTIRELSDHVAYRLRKANYCATLVRVKIRYGDFSTHTHQAQLPQPIDQDSLLFTAANELFNEAWTPGRPIRLIGVGAAGLVQTMHQLPLFDEKPEKERKLLEAVDGLKQKFGKDVIKRGSRLKNQKVTHHN